MYKVEHISVQASQYSGYWQISKKGKVLKTFFGPDAKEDAENEMARYIEDDQWNASNRD